MLSGGGDEVVPLRSRTAKFERKREEARGRRDVKQVVEEGAPPLGWVQAVAKVDHAEHRIRELMAELADLERQHLLRDAEVCSGAEDLEPQIKKLSADITRLFRTLDLALKKIVQDADDQLMLLNVQKGLVTRVSALHDQYRQAQQRYTEEAKKKQILKDKMSQFLVSDTTRQWEEEEERECRVDRLKLKGYSQEAISRLMMKEEIERERAEQIQDIAASMKELNGMFRDLHALVVDQGTMLDRVDKNVEESRAYMQASTQDIRTARQTKRCLVQ